MKVTHITVSGTEFHPGETMDVVAYIQKDLLDIGTYDLAMYVKKKRAPASAWELVSRKDGMMDPSPWVGSAAIPMPGFVVPSKVGEYYVGVLDTGNIGSSQGATVDEVLRNTGAFRLFSVTMPPPVGKAQLNIYTYPSDATIYIDGKKAGVGSVIGKNVNPGIYQITAKKFLYEDETVIVTVGVGEVMPIELYLNPLLDSDDLGKIALLAGAGVVLAGIAYVVINKRARARTIELGRTAWTKGGELGRAAYNKAGELYVAARDA